MMSNTSRTVLLGSLLKSVSRSFYLSLRILPVGMREPVGLAYLFARAADTVADTSLIDPQKRLELLLLLREQLNRNLNPQELKRIEIEVARKQQDSSEKALLESIGPAFSLLSQFDQEDRDSIRVIVSAISEGMEFDLKTFPDESSGRLTALKQYSDLDRYTYMVAGCVGEFWTRMSFAHVPVNYRADSETMTDRGIRLGKALQMTNVLRDCAKDLRIGRCYLPAEKLAEKAISASDLLNPDASLVARPILFELVGKTLEHFREGLEYVLAIPRSAVRLRLASLWPILIGLETLLVLVQNDRWLDPEKPSKIRRSDVYWILATSLVMVIFDGRTRHRVQGLIDKVEVRIHPNLR